MNNDTPSRPWLGCIADDSTGASDLASFLANSGFKTLQINGLPSKKQLAQIRNVDAVVIALKSRTIASEDAVALSLASLAALQTLGCSKFYFKYCSTFDSTGQGNIGPVTDALMAELNVESTIICPALPINGRTVYQGHLFVFDQLLSDSPMKDHPLTPMHESSILKMIEAQGKGKAALIPLTIIEQGRDAIRSAAQGLKSEHQYLVIDAVNQAHLAVIGASLEDFSLITGGSGLALGLGAEYTALGGTLQSGQDTVAPIKAPCLLLSGSCSAMTQKQVAAYSQEHPAMYLDIDKLMHNEQSVDSICEWLATVKEQNPLVYATASAETVSENQQRFGASEVAQHIEKTLAEVAIQAKAKLGFRNFVIAGGETSGAVVSALNIDSFYIGKTIAPGVPMLQTSESCPLNLALKSGNFGQVSFFKQAAETLSCS